jgi:hypothetical protein
MRTSILAALCALGVLACGDDAANQASSGTTTTSTGSGGGGGAGGGTGAGGGGGAEDPVSKAIADFTEAFQTEQYSRAPDLAAQLDAAAQIAPDRADVNLLRGHVRLWRLSEWGRDLSQDTSEIPAIALSARAAFEAARDLAPDDHRLLGWLGPLKIGIGNATTNNELIAEGFSDVEDGVAAYPEFNLFVRALVRASAPNGSAELAEAVEAMWQTLDVCVGEPVDRDNLDYAPYMDLETDTGTKRVCWNDEKARHNFEGFFLYFGDLLVKAGDPDTATAAYQSAQLSSTYATWPYRTELEARIQDAPARAALFADADPSNDPEIVAASSHQCAACHAR